MSGTRIANKICVEDGEELIGAKQNRIVNATFLIAGNTEIIIPVSCVEQGRWSYVGDIQNWTNMDRVNLPT